MELTLAILILILFIELFYAPRIGCTRNRDVLLWYTHQNQRFYIRLFTF